MALCRKECKASMDFLSLSRSGRWLGRKPIMLHRSVLSQARAEQLTMWWHRESSTPELQREHVGLEASFHLKRLSCVGYFPESSLLTR